MKHLVHWTIRKVTAPSSAYFAAHATEWKTIQEKLLLGIIRKNEASAYGREFGFSAIRDVRDFIGKVPLVKYDDIRHRIMQIDRPDAGILTSEQVKLFEPTSGSSADSKFIPYTQSLQTEFEQAINPWLHDLYKHIPGIRRGSHYWSISPALEKKPDFRTSVPIGFADDTAYLGWKSSLLKKVLAVPPHMTKQRSYVDFQQVLSLHLLQNADLSLVSVWNPGFFRLIVEHILEHTETLLRRLPGNRRKNVERAFVKNNTADILHAIWPKLSLISCWMDAEAKYGAASLQRLFPNVLMQGKGLIATECFISFPLTDAQGSVLAYNSHYIEFISRTTGTPVPPDCLQTGERYEVAVTTGGGFYRYRTGDIIRISSFWNGLPVITFCGRDRVVDICGEKLHFDFVNSALRSALKKEEITPEFLMLAPERNDLPGYIMYVQAELTGNLLKNAENELCKNCHYAYARKLGQLSPLRLFIIERDAEKTYREWYIRQGIKVGDTKAPGLNETSGWHERFTGHFAEII